MTLKVVCFDCDGVLADTISSWGLIHEHFGTGDTDMLSRFIAGEISDVEFMADDIRQWKSVQPQIHRDDLLRCYSGVKLMSGAQQVVEALRGTGRTLRRFTPGTVADEASLLAENDVMDPDHVPRSLTRSVQRFLRGLNK